MKMMRISCDKVHFLGVGQEVSKEDWRRLRFNMWEENLKNGTIERLCEQANAKQVYGFLSCEHTEHGDILYYRIACEDRNVKEGDTSNSQEAIKAATESENNTKKGDVEEFCLTPNTYMVFQTSGNFREEQEKITSDVLKEALCDYIPGSGYLAKLDVDSMEFEDGAMLVEKFRSFGGAESGPEELEVWIPVQKENVL